MPKPKQRLQFYNFGYEGHGELTSRLGFGQVPTTADEYLAAGVDFEEAGEKWRAGDAAKSTRFFVRAIDCYDEGLKKFPTSFDLAYNRGRLQYELTQHPKLLKELPGSLLDLLQVALESSKYALTLNGEDPDALFNTAQVLTSIVDTINEQGSAAYNPDQPSLLLQEALEIFAQCLKQQEAAYSAFQNQLRSDDNEPADAILDDTTIANTSSTSGNLQAKDGDQVQEQWASVIVPVSKSSILDTILAQLETMSTLYSLLRSDKLIPSIVAYAQPLVVEKLPFYMTETGQDLEAAITLAGYVSAEADAKFRLMGLDMQSYIVSVQQAWKDVQLTSNASHVEGLCDRAESYINCSNTLRLSGNGNSLDCSKLRWDLLTAANQDLTIASSFKDDNNVVKIHLKKGDVELWRFQLGQAPRGLEVAAKNKAVLLKNAEKHYRGAVNLSTVAVAYDNEDTQAKVKELLAKALGGNAKPLTDAQAQSKEAGDILADAVEEGLVDWNQLQGLRDLDAMVE
ncbi:UPF0656 protein [Lachnellula hyalina]|uniref:UPF0656 protein n=1 Tax=Lachnellula hyalina TaxID=1316788 RepID=A0A8H8R3D9_9HELO|nr:UPF0656 protein [Lachnellula hyalina]TVY27778.1 UPF0656 protein [Lachnellula hyalina]